MSFDNFFEEVKEEFNYEEKKQEFIDNMLISLIYSLKKFGNQLI
jgi:hypothetical protein